ncbi:MAG: hypothetical protein IJE46_03600 [Clostridia bacterium]|nr:hypothetical protein [Clostridia bacterium]
MNIIQMLGLALSTVVLTNVLKQYRPEFATVVITILGALFFVYISSSVTKIFDYISRICNYTGINIIYIEVMFKVIGVSYICEFVSAVCKDAGVSSVAVKVDIAGKLIILLASMPVFKELINIIIGIAT